MLLGPPDFGGEVSTEREQGQGTYTFSYFPSTPAHHPCSDQEGLIIRGIGVCLSLCLHLSDKVRDPP